MNSTKDNQWMTPKEAAIYVGVMICTIYKWLKLSENPLPHTRTSPRIIRINKDQLEEWLKSYSLKEE